MHLFQRQVYLLHMVWSSILLVLLVLDYPPDLKHINQQFNGATERTKITKMFVPKLAIQTLISGVVFYTN